MVLLFEFQLSFSCWLIGKLITFKFALRSDLSLVDYFALVCSVNLFILSLSWLLSTTRKLVNVLRLERLNLILLKATRSFSIFGIRFLRKYKVVILAKSALIFCILRYWNAGFSWSAQRNNLIKALSELIIVGCGQIVRLWWCREVMQHLVTACFC